MIDFQDEDIDRISAEVETEDENLTAEIPYEVTGCSMEVCMHNSRYLCFHL